MALGWLWGRNPLAINTLWGGSKVALRGFASISAFYFLLLPDRGFGVALRSHRCPFCIQPSTFIEATFRLLASRSTTGASLAMWGLNTNRPDTTEGCRFTSLFKQPPTLLSIPSLCAERRFTTQREGKLVPAPLMPLRCPACCRRAVPLRRPEASHYRTKKEQNRWLTGDSAGCKG